MPRIAGPEDHVVVVGGGFSGALFAVNLMRHEGPRVTLIERRDRQLARGVAYSAAHPDHLLNVRAGNMSALPDDPGHFVRWLEAHGKGDRTTFVPRTPMAHICANCSMRRSRTRTDGWSMSRARSARSIR